MVDPQAASLLKPCATDNRASTSSPIDRIPTEILSDIFFHATALREDDDHHGSPIAYTYSPLLLSAVCQRWRIVATSLPGIWTLIKPRFKAPCGEDGLEAVLLRDWVQRTCDCPLSLNITDPLYSRVVENPGHTGYDRVSDVIECVTRDIVDIIASILPRCEEIRLDMEIANQFPYLNLDDVVDSLARGTPLLRDLHVVSQDPREEVDLRCSPKLQCLVAPYHPFQLFRFGDTLSLSHLHRIQTMGSIRDLARIFNIFPSLWRCDFEHDSNRSESEGTSMKLSSKQITEFGMRCGNFGNEMWDILDLPSLRKLRINCIHTSSTPWPSIFSFFVRCRPALDYLELSFIHGIREDDLIAVLAGMPSLRVLQLQVLHGLTSGKMNAGFWRALAGHIEMEHARMGNGNQSKSGMICPLLEELYLHPGYGFELSNIAPIVLSRFPSGSDVGAKPIQYRPTMYSRLATITMPQSNLRVLEVRSCMSTPEAFLQYPGISGKIAAGLVVESRKADIGRAGMIDLFMRHAPASVAGAPQPA